MSEERGSWGGAILSGALAALALPLTVPMLLAFGADRASFQEVPMASGLSQLFAEAGFFGYLLVGLGIVLAALSGALMGWSTRVPAFSPAFALLPVALPAALSALGVLSAMRATTLAIGHAAADDRLTLLIAAEGETMSLQPIALTLATTLCAGISLGCAAGLLAPRRGPRLVTLTASGVLSLAFASLAFRVEGLAMANHLCGNAAPADRMSILSAAILEPSPLGVPANALLGAALLVALIGALVLATRQQGLAGATVFTCVVVAAIGVRGSMSMADRSYVAANEFLMPPPGPTLVPLNGTTLMGDRLVMLNTDDEPQLAADLKAALADGDQLSLALTPDLTWKRLEHALQLAHEMGVKVELVGASEGSPLQAPPLYAAFVSAWSHAPTAVPIELLWVDEPCPDCEGRATADGTALIIRSVGQTTRWQRVDAQVGFANDFKAVSIDWNDRPDLLGQIAMTAISHEHVLAVRLHER